MKRTAYLVSFAALLALLISFICGAAAFAQDFPEYKGFVNDYAGIISDNGSAQLEKQLAQLEKDTSAEVAVVTIQSLQGEPLEDYANKLFEKWGIGKKGKDNGVLLLVSVDDRKMRIEVGYGLEPIITDGRAGRIRDDDILPLFRDGDYEGGITAGVNSIEKYIRDNTPPAPLEDNPIRSFMGGWVELGFIMAVLTTYLFGFMARSKSIWLGGIWGAIAGLIMGFAIGGIAAVIITAIISIALGLGLDALLSRNYKSLSNSGKSTSWTGSWGGFGSGGGSSGGGFGGFGGGMSGGGGSSGSW